MMQCRLCSAASYNYKYLTDIRFDNVYITPYFRRKDRERKKQVAFESLF